MCKTWMVTYTCNHSLPFRLSTCRGVFSTQPPSEQGNSFYRPPLKPACSSPMILNLHSTSVCAPCQFDLASKTMVDGLVILRTRAGQGEDIDMRKEAEEMQNKLYRLQRGIPWQVRLKTMSSPRVGRAVGGSGLKSEIVAPEEEQRDEEDLESAKYLEDWAKPWGEWQSSIGCDVHIDADIPVEEEEENDDGLEADQEISPRDETSDKSFEPEEEVGGETTPAPPDSSMEILAECGSDIPPRVHLESATISRAESSDLSEAARRKENTSIPFKAMIPQPRPHHSAQNQTFEFQSPETRRGNDGVDKSSLLIEQFRTLNAGLCPS